MIGSDEPVRTRAKDMGEDGGQVGASDTQPKNKFDFEERWD